MSIKLLKVKRPEEKSEGGRQQQQQEKQQVLKSGNNHRDPEVEPKSNELIESGDDDTTSKQEKNGEKFEAQLVWRNIFLFVLLHSSIPVALMMIADPQKRPQWRTVLWLYLSGYVSGFGITGGAHRLWSHKAYKARAPLELLLMVLQTMAGQNSIYTWCRDHRVHHKYSETDADPHNIKRGFFFAHMGWLCCRKHPEVREKGALIDMSDLEANPIVMFQHRNFWWLASLFTVLLPTMVPVWFWQERFWTSFVFSFMLRYLLSLHGTWLVNSAAHYHGSRPYDKHIEARESPWVIMFGLGEGFHNYHHTFPFDYSTSEFGKYFNITTTLIDLFALTGLVYDRRKMDKATIMRRQLRTGEGREAIEGSEKGDEVSTGKVQNNLEATEKLDDQKRAELTKMEISSKLVSPFNMNYISGPTSLKYTM